jgi:hypothetical protein
MPDVPKENDVSSRELKQYLGRERLRRVHQPNADAPSADGKHLKLPHIDYFLAAARHGNFAKAAAEFDVSPAAVGQAIAELEENLGPGARLFERNQTGARITPQGEAILEHAERLLAAEDALRVAFAKASGQALPRRHGEHEAPSEPEVSPIVFDVEAIRRFRQDTAESVRAAIEFIEEHSTGHGKAVSFPAGVVEELKHALPEVAVSGDSVERMAGLLDELQASASDAARTAMLEPGERASDKFRELHATAAERFTQHSVRFVPVAQRPERPRAR